MGWTNIPKPKPTSPGIWEEYTFGGDRRGWLMRCPPAFKAQITLNGGSYFMEVNHQGFGPHKTLEAAQIAAETKIVTAFREMLPVYKILMERLEKRSVERPPRQIRQDFFNGNLLALMAGGAALRFLGYSGKIFLIGKSPKYSHRFLQLSTL